jgi:hypothetical protein
MNTKTIRGKTLGIFLSLVLVLSMAAVLLPAQTVSAATSITVTQPNGGECIKGSSNYIVKWTETSDGVVTADITVSTDNGVTWSAPTSLGGLGPDAAPTAYQQSVVMPNTNSNLCLVKVTISGPGDTTTSDVSDAVFTIDAQAPTVTLGSPLGGECWQGSSSDNVTWLAMDNFAGSLTYHLEFTTNGTSWSDITPAYSSTQGNKYYTWSVPAANSINCKTRITATDCAGNATTQTSGAFTIDSTAPISVIITQPNGGETLTAGAIYHIQWTASDNLPGNLTYQLSYSTTGCGGAYTNIGSAFSGAQGANDYPWTVPGVKTTLGCIKIRATDCAGLFTEVNSAATFTIQDTTPPVVTLISPNGGESWRAGSVHNITWTATDNVPGSLNYYLYYCTSYTDCPTCSIPIVGPISGPQGANSYAWTVPAPIPPSTTNACRVKVTAFDTATTPNSAMDCSNGNFSIVVETGTPVTVQLTSPSASGITWQAGTAQTITWTATSTIPSDTLDITLEYSSIGTFPGTVITTLLNRDQTTVVPGCFCWAVPTGAPASTYKIKITATIHGTISSASDESDNAFTVSADDPDWGITTDSIALSTGWNFISLKLIPTCCPSAASGVSSFCTCTYPIEGVLASIMDKVDRIWYYDNNGTTTGWKGYMPNNPTAPLMRMEDGKAYWVYVTAPCTLTFQGRKSATVYSFPPSYNAYAGWNMIGYKDTGSTRTVQQYLGVPCPSTIYSLPAYEQTTFGVAGWTYKNCTDTLTTGHGYWVYYYSAGTYRPLE